MRTSNYIDLAPFLVSLLACGVIGCASLSDAGGFSGPGGDFGATPGGIQDMTFARETVQAGRVPPPEAFVVEAMFSEHDLPLEGEPCTTLLCLRAATGLALNETDEPSAWVQVGMSSTIDPETFQRPDLSVVAVVDVSGSMGWDYGARGNPAALARSLLTELSQRLGEGDRFSIVTYGSSSRVHLAPVSASEDERIGLPFPLRRTSESPVPSHRWPRVARRTWKRGCSLATKWPQAKSAWPKRYA